MASCGWRVESLKEKVRVDWQFMLVAGIFLGALAASLSDKSFKLE